MMNRDLVKIGKSIIVKGTKAVTIGAGITIVRTIAKEGLDGFKKLNVDKLLK